jgi:hypothetical protein
LGIITAANVIALDPHTGDSSLTRHACQGALNTISIGHVIQFMNRHGETCKFRFLKDLLDCRAVTAICLAKNDNLRIENKKMGPWSVQCGSLKHHKNHILYTRQYKIEHYGPTWCFKVSLLIKFSLSALILLLLDGLEEEDEFPMER